MADGLFWDLNTMKSTIAITYEDSFWERLSTCDGISVPFLPLFPRRYLISGGSGAGLPLLSSTHNCQWSTFPDPFWMFNSQLMVDCFSHSSLCLLAYWCSRRNQHVLIQSFRLWLLLLSASPPLPTKYPSDHWTQNPKRLYLSDVAGDYRNCFSSSGIEFSLAFLAARHFFPAPLSCCMWRFCLVFGFNCWPGRPTFFVEAVEVEDIFRGEK